MSSKPGSIPGVKISVSLREDDVAFLDAYAGNHGMASRSAALQHAVELLRAEKLGAAYADAWAEWEGEAEMWEGTVSDGLSPG
jgi:hypothetical protein